MSFHSMFRRSIIRAAGLASHSNPDPLAILTYHSVGSRVPASLPVHLFDKQMALLVSDDIAKPLNWLHLPVEVNTRQALVTFDDGYLDNFDFAAPILACYGIKALFFLTTAFIECERDITLNFKSYRGLKPMTWHQIESLVKDGHSIGLHGHTHQNFRSMSYLQATDEMSLSVEIVRKRLGLIPNTFAYPFGQFQHRRTDLLKVFQKLGLRYIFSTDNRVAHYSDLAGGEDPVLLPRLRIDSHDTLEMFEQKILGQWDGMARLQKLKSCIATRSISPLVKFRV